MGMLEIILSKKALQINISWWLLLFISLITGIIFYFLRKKETSGRYRIQEVEIGLKNYRVKIKPSFEDLQVAYKVWVEVATRKLGLKIDEKNDVIVEVYNSWYEFFKITRETLKEIPAEKIQNPETQKIISITLNLLNDIIRPHLTKWQAKFRKWYNEETEHKKNKKLSPQKIQSNYPEYQDLLKDMFNVNENIIEYRKSLEKLLGFNKTKGKG